MSQQEHQRLAAYLHGELSATEAADIETRLRDEPQLAEALIALARDEAILVHWARSRSASRALDEAAAGPDDADAMETQNIRRPAGEPTGHRNRSVWAVGAALCAIAIVGAVSVAIVRQVAPTTAQPLATLQYGGGRVRLVRADATSVLIESTTPVYEGDQIVTEGNQSAAVIVFPDETSLALVADTSIVLAGDSPKRIEVRQGRLAATVAPQPQREPMIVRTPSAQLDVLGTQFLLESSGGATDLSVTEGRVLVTRTADGATIEVAGGERVVASADQAPLQARALVGPSDTWSEDFEHGLPESWNRAEWTSDDLPPSSHGAAVAQKVRQADGDYWQIATPKAWSEGLVTIHPDSHLHFTYRLSKPDWFQIFVSTRRAQPGTGPTATYRFKDERLWWPLQPGSWRTASIPLAAFGRVSDFSETPLPAGELPFEILFTSKDNPLSLAIDRVWIDRKGPGQFQVEELP